MGIAGKPTDVQTAVNLAKAPADAILLANGDGTYVVPAPPAGERIKFLHVMIQRGALDFSGRYSWCLAVGYSDLLGGTMYVYDHNGQPAPNGTILYIRKEIVKV